MSDSSLASSEKSAEVSSAAGTVALDGLWSFRRSPLVVDEKFAHSEKIELSEAAKILD